MQIRIALLGDFNPAVVAHQAIPKALKINGLALGVTVGSDWIFTSKMPPVERFGVDFDGLWVVPASPYQSMENVLAAIRFARENGLPFLGTCGGYQHALIEFARNVLGLAADHSETSPTAEMALISQLACPLIEEKGEVFFTSGSRLAELFENEKTTEGYHCSFGLNPVYLPLFEDKALKINGFNTEGLPKAFSLEGHPFFVGTAFQPERSGLAGVGHPLIRAFLSASAQKETGQVGR